MEDLECIYEELENLKQSNYNIQQLVDWYQENIAVFSVNQVICFYEIVRASDEINKQVSRVEHNLENIGVDFKILKNFPEICKIFQKK